MATETQATTPTLTPYRLTVGQFARMIDAGVFPETAHVELLGGLLVDKMTKNDPHNYAVDRFSDILRRFLPDGWFVREEKSVRLGRWDRPEPDLMVIRGRRQDFRGAPGPNDLGLIVEVADSSYAKDRGPKWRRYAAAGIPAYWIVHLPRKQVEVYTEPAGRGKAAAYQACVTYDADAEVPVLLDGVVVGRFPVRDLLS